MVTTTNIRGKGTVNFCTPLNHDFVIDCMLSGILPFQSMQIFAMECSGGKRMRGVIFGGNGVPISIELEYFGLAH